MTSPKRGNRGLGPVVACLVLVFILPPARVDAAKPPARISATLSASAAPVGQKVFLSGRVSPPSRVVVRLEVLVGKKWRKVSTDKKSRSNGAFRLSVPTTSAGVFRYRASTSGKGSSTARHSSVSRFKVRPAKGTGTVGASSFRMLRAVGSDQVSSPNVDAGIRDTTAAADGWFATQTTGSVRPRWVRDAAGNVVVTPLVLPKPGADYDAMTFKDFAAAVEQASPAPAGQKTVVWFVGSGPACGVTGSGYTVMYESACGIHPSTGEAFPYGGSYLQAHELTHAFGATATCAPHATGDGHVDDDSKDVIYSGPVARDFADITLDVGHDDYYSTGNASCPGIESSPYWTATSDPRS